MASLILFCYDGSVFSRKIELYLAFRGLPYEKCIQPPLLPRPDLDRLGIHYRRIPLLAIGRDIYCDTRAIIQKLEEAYPEGRLSLPTPFENGFESIVEGWTMNAGPLMRAVGCMPTTLPILSDPSFVSDRTEFLGAKFDVETIAENRALSLSQMRIYFNTIESLLVDGRKYLLNSDQPGLADVHAVWLFEWAANLLSLDSAGKTSKSSFPHVYSWIERCQQVFAAGQAQQTPEVVTSDEALRNILAAGMEDGTADLDVNDAMQLSVGQMVKISPTDTGCSHADVGELVSLTLTEVTIKTRVPEDNSFLRLHFPRENFRIEAVPQRQQHQRHDSGHVQQ